MPVVLKRWWRTTFGLVAIVALGFALATLAIGVVAFETTHEALEQQLDHRIATETQALIDEGDDGPAGVADAIRRRETARGADSLDYRLVAPDGATVAGQLDAEVPTQAGFVELLPYVHTGERRIAQSLTTILPGGHRLLVAADRGVIDDMDATLLRLFAGAFGAMLVLGIGAAWIVGLVTRHRLAQIDRTALAIIDGDLSQRMPVSGTGDEFDRVSATLNRMLDRIGTLMDNLRQVSSDVAHDLRTPLTRLHNRLEEALATQERERQHTAITAAADQSRELLDIFAALLRIAEVEGQAAQSHFQRLDLSALVENIVETYRPDMEASDHLLTATIEPGLTIDGDRRLLQQLVANLFDNVLTHTPAGTNVSVDLARSPRGARLCLSDDGPDASADESDHLFRRFSRGEASRSRPGHGLGLALVRAIADAHRGRATIDRTSGFAVMIDLEVANQAVETNV
ncbi:sensor histidine kinase [Sphingomonas faeni]|uniref:sensor histidine kinase n=1 Tax=Sphingomonas faeni TaxID=185950 RepID=UPI003350295A